jgi:recombination protein RecA
MTNKWMAKLSKELGIYGSELKKSKAPVPLPSPSLNWATVAGGFTPGKVTIAYGPESSGKSMICMMAIAELHRQDPDAIAIWFDAEFSFNANMFEKVGGDLNRIVVRPSNDPLTIFDYIGNDLKEMLQDGAPVKAIVIDSIKSIRYPKDIRKESTNQIMGGAGAAYLGSALKMVIPVIAEFGLLSMFVQQVSAQIDPMKALRNPYVISEGHALKHAADLMLEITRVDSKKGSLEHGETITGAAAQVGHMIRVKVKKNRLGVPARQAQFMFHYDRGVIDTEVEIYELGKSLGLIYHPTNPETGKENVMMWQFGSYAPVRGEPAMKQMVISNKKLRQELLEACYKHQDSPVAVDIDGVVSDAPDPDDVL